MEGQRFRFKYGVFGLLLRAMGLGPGLSKIELLDDTLKVRLGWGFAATIPRSAIRSAQPFHGLVGGIGVHGWRGRWLVNGAATGIVELDLDPVQRAFVTGFPVRLTQLRVSLEEPERFLAQLGL